MQLTTQVIPDMYHMVFELVKEKSFIFIYKLFMNLSCLQQNNFKLFTLYPLVPRKGLREGDVGDNKEH